MKYVQLILFLVLSISVNSQTLSGYAVRVTDGDTFVLLDENNVQHRIRLDGIDAPERGQAFSNKSKDYLAKMIEGKRLTVTYKKKDQYGRIIGKVATDKTKDVNLKMIKSGMAWHYSHHNSDIGYAAAEKKARQRKMGLWFDKHPVNPYDFRLKNK